MHADLAAFLAGRVPLGEEMAVWREGLIQLRITSYLGTEAPPLDYVTSVRAVVFRDDSVLAFHDRVGVHVLPGGRREPGETLEETLRREVLEETGWRVAVGGILGFAHFHHLTPRPPHYPYPYPDFLQVIYLAKAVEFVPEARIADEYVDQSYFTALRDVHALDLPAGERQFLDAAVRILPQRGATNSSERR